MLKSRGPTDRSEPLGALVQQWDMLISELAGAVVQMTEFWVAGSASTLLDRSDIESVITGVANSLHGIESIVERGYEPYGAGSLIVGIRTFVDGYSSEEPERLKRGWTLLDRTLARSIGASGAPTGWSESAPGPFP